VSFEGNLHLVCHTTFQLFKLSQSYNLIITLLLCIEMFGLLVLLYNLFLLHLNAELVYVICYQGN